MNSVKGFEDYKSLVYLQSMLGDVKTVEAVCHIWRQIHTEDSLRVKEVVDSNSQIILTGRCQDVETALDLCKYLTSIGVLVTYEKTVIHFEF